MIRIGSLCSGYGGLDMGLMTVVGGEVAWHGELDPDASRILDHHWPTTPNIGDIAAVEWSLVPRVDWLTAGYPCQPFSLAGKRKGAKDVRHLWPHVAHAVGVLRPRWVLLENVAGHVSLGLDTVVGDLAALGYDARWGVVRASEAGAPHARARIFLVAADARGEAFRLGTGLRPRGPGPIWRRRPDYSTSPAPADAAGLGRGEGWAESAGWVWGPASVLGGASDAPHADGEGLQGPGQLHSAPGEGETTAHDCGIAWGAYGPAVDRWERVLSRPAPTPVETGPKGGTRLSPVFVEWLMGLPAGHVTDVPGLTRNAQLKALGNGVVPQQAALALSLLLPAMEAAA